MPSTECEQLPATYTDNHAVPVRRCNIKCWPCTELTWEHCWGNQATLAIVSSGPLAPTTKHQYAAEEGMHTLMRNM
jgi:hypothetical protein